MIDSCVSPGGSAAEGRCRIPKTQYKDDTPSRSAACSPGKIMIGPEIGSHSSEDTRCGESERAHPRRGFRCEDGMGA